MAVGAAPGSGDTPDPKNLWPIDIELVIGGGVLRDHKWWVRSLQSYAIDGYGPQGCGTQVTPRLVPGGPVIIAQCLNGGTDGQGFVAVAGQPRGYAFPVVVFAATCGGTSAKVEGDRLVVYTEGLKPGAAYPGAKQPTFVFTWPFGRPLADDPKFSEYCTSPDDYFDLSRGAR